MKRSLLALAAFLPALALADPTPLAVDSAQSRVEIVVKATVDSFTGTLEAYDAEIAVDSGRVTAARFAFHFADVHTGKEGRDEAMNEWQDTRHHPDGVFVLKTIESVDNRLEAHGTLRLHDVTREVAFPVTVTTDRKLYSIDGEAPLDTRDFGLPIIRKFAVLKVDPVVRVRFHLQGLAKPAGVAAVTSAK